MNLNCIECLVTMLQVVHQEAECIQATGSVSDNLTDAGPIGVPWPSDKRHQTMTEGFQWNLSLIEIALYRVPQKYRPKVYGSEGRKNGANQILILCMFFSTSGHLV